MKNFLPRHKKRTLLPVQATNYKFTRGFALWAFYEAVAYSGSNYATPEQVLQGVGLPSVKRSFSGWCGRTGVEPPSDQSSI
jgi:hypothetical protein